MSLWRKWKNLSGKWFKIGWRTFSRAGRRQTTSKWPFSSSPPSKGETPAWSVELMFMNENVEKRVVGEGLKSLTERVQIHPSCSIGAVSNGWHKKGNLNSAQTRDFFQWKKMGPDESRRKWISQVKNGGPGLQMIQGGEGQEGAGEPPLVTILYHYEKAWKPIVIHLTTDPCNKLLSIQNHPQ